MVDGPASGVGRGVIVGVAVGEDGSPGEETVAGTEGGMAEERGEGGVGRGVADGGEEEEEGEVVATGNEDVVGFGEAVRFKTMAETAVIGGAGG